MSFLKDSLNGLKDSYDGIKEVIQESLSSKVSSESTEEATEQTNSFQNVKVVNSPFRNVKKHENSASLLKVFSLLNRLEDNLLPTAIQMDFNDEEQDSLGELTVSFIGSYDFHVNVNIILDKFQWSDEQSKGSQELALYHKISQDIVSQIGILQSQEANYPRFVSQNMVGTRFNTAQEFLEALHTNENQFIKFAQELNLISLYPKELKDYMIRSVKRQNRSYENYDIFGSFSMKDEAEIVKDYNNIVEKYGLAHVDPAHITFATPEGITRPVFIQLKFATPRSTSSLKVNLLPDVLSELATSMPVTDGDNEYNYMDAIIALLVQEIDHFSVHKAMKEMTSESNKDIGSDVIKTRIENDQKEYQELKKYLLS